MIKLNVNAQKTAIDSEFKIAIDKIKLNANAGVSTTELIIAKDLYNEVRNKINEFVKEQKIDGYWLTLSGPVGMQSSIACGNNSRLMKFKLRS